MSLFDSFAAASDSTQVHSLDVFASGYGGRPTLRGIAGMIASVSSRSSIPLFPLYTCPEAVCISKRLSSPYRRVRRLRI